mmetsp:Transcript_15794/g.36276  ORF Transcript_15794/g.36276 Transcript_15794/m.36276 type:complete len:484 (-) Transcript_15794:576-2027(-)
MLGSAFDAAGTATREGRRFKHGRRSDGLGGSNHTSPRLSRSKTYGGKDTDSISTFSSSSRSYHHLSSRKKSSSPSTTGVPRAILSHCRSAPADLDKLLETNFVMELCQQEWKSITSVMIRGGRHCFGITTTTTSNLKNEQQQQQVHVMGGETRKGGRKTCSNTTEMLRSCCQDGSILEWMGNDDDDICCLDIPRREFAMVSVQDSKILVFGGRGESKSTVLRSCAMLDLNTRKWTKLPSLRTARYGCCATIVDDIVYIFGGNDEHYCGLRSVEAFNWKNQQWISNSLAIPRMPKERTFGCAHYIQEKVYLCGGHDDRIKWISQMDVWDPVLYTWSTTSSKMPNPRWGFGSVGLCNRYIVMAGGYNGEGPISDCQVFDALQGTWHTMPSLTCARRDCGMTVLENKLLVVGGFTNAKTFLDTSEYLQLPNCYFPNNENKKIMTTREEKLSKSSESNGQEQDPVDMAGWKERAQTLKDEKQGAFSF